MADDEKTIAQPCPHCGACIGWDIYDDMDPEESYDYGWCRDLFDRAEVEDRRHGAIHVCVACRECVA